MKYVSTRGSAPILSFDKVLLAGLARDGGLYVPESWPRFTRAEIRSLRGLPYADVAFHVMRPFIGGITESEFRAMVERTYAAFGHPSVAPMKQLDRNVFLTELFHGPTLAFKDYALQLVGRLFDHMLAKKGERVTIIGATSGDTGSAAIEALKDRERVEVFIFHPNRRVSEVQRRQMTTVESDNIHNIALEGTFDDCQDMVKLLFADESLRARYNFSAVNSINWARIMAQIVYYFTSALALGSPDRRIAFAVPTGNFGNVFSGYCALRMGLPIERFIVATNANDILARFLDTGRMETGAVVPTLSPSMDIQVSSNFERLLFEHYRRNGKSVAKAMEEFRRMGKVDFGRARWQAMRKLFSGYRLGDNATKDTIARIWRETGELIDPHTAIGVAAAREAELDPDVAVIAMATAHPAKFPQAVEEATGVRPELPPRLAQLMTKPERCTVLANDPKAVKDFLDARLAAREAA
jgi:threonine synthase